MTEATGDPTPSNLDRTALPDLVRRAVARGGRGGQPVHVALEARRPCPEVLADAPRLEQAVAILLTDALRRAGPGSTVHIDLTPRGREVEIAIASRDVPSGLDRVPIAPGGSADLAVGSPMRVARQLVEAQGGRLDTETSRAGTIHRLALPVALLA